MFYKVEDADWRADFRDGVQFWRMSPPPRGGMPNAASPSRDAELLARGKIFKLRYNWYMEKKGWVALLTP